MATIDLHNMQGEVVGEVNLDDNIFAITPHEDVLSRVLHNLEANKRQGTSKTKTRSERRGGGRKPYRQKGTGRARHGSIRSAMYVGGGIIFGPRPRSYRYTIPKKMRRLAMKSALATKFQDKAMIVLDELDLSEPKTKEMAKILKNIGVTTSALLVMPERVKNVELSSANIRDIKTALVNTINVFDILKFDKFIITKAALAKVEEVYQ